MKASVRKKGKRYLGRTIRARVRRGALEPFERIGIAEGKEVTVTIGKAPRRDLEALARAAGKWKGTLDATGLIRAIYRSRLIPSRRLPGL
jgi:hypothetical protein